VKSMMVEREDSNPRPRHYETLRVNARWKSRKRRAPASSSLGCASTGVGCLRISSLIAWKHMSGAESFLTPASCYTCSPKSLTKPTALRSC
jgi:hypothetical protein